MQREIYDVDNGVVLLEDIKPVIIFDVQDEDEEEDEDEDYSFDELRDIANHYQKLLRRRCVRTCACGGKTSTVPSVRKTHEQTNKHRELAKTQPRNCVVM
jgi:hypothetical protein